MIYVYGDKGVSLRMLNILLIQLFQKFPKEKISVVDHMFILKKFKFSQKSEVLIMPGGTDIHYCSLLNGQGNKNIQQFVEDGGMYVGICAGAYYACSAIYFSRNSYAISERRELSFFPGQAIGSLPKLTNGYYSSDCSRPKAVVDIMMNNSLYQAYYHGGCYFVGLQNQEVIAKYSTGAPAIISDNIGNGKYLLSGVHFEVSRYLYAKYLYNKDICVKIDQNNSKEEEMLLHLPQSHQNIILDRILTHIVI